MKRYQLKLIKITQKQSRRFWQIFNDANFEKELINHIVMWIVQIMKNIFILRFKLLAFSAWPSLHQFGLENTSLLVDLTRFINRRARNITSTQVSANLVGPKTLMIQIWFIKSFFVRNLEDFGVISNIVNTGLREINWNFENSAF